MATTEPNKVIVHVGPSDSHALPSTRVHHHDFPEIHAEGVSHAEACAQLTNVLNRVLDSAPSGDVRAALERAIAEVREFVAQNP